jgi:hypothetical protein
MNKAQQLYQLHNSYDKHVATVTYTGTFLVPDDIAVRMCSYGALLEASHHWSRTGKRVSQGYMTVTESMRASYLHAIYIAAVAAGYGGALLAQLDRVKLISKVFHPDGTLRRNRVDIDFKCQENLDVCLIYKPEHPQHALVKPLLPKGLVDR